MKRLNPEKLSVEYRSGVNKIEPIIPRRYTLTHSDITGQLLLTIGQQYAYDKINPMRDEVLAEWKPVVNGYILYGYVYVNGEFSSVSSYIRNKIFVRELPLALESIRYGDRTFFKAHPELDNAPIYIHFDSAYPCLNRVEYWETPSNYK